MKLITLENVSNVDVEYPIAEPDMSSGEVRFDDNGNIRSTGQTLIWSIGAGETKAFPDYVADILLKRYGVEDLDRGNFILHIVGESTPKEETVENSSNPLVCKFCGYAAKNDRARAMHIASKHADRL